MFGKSRKSEEKKRGTVQAPPPTFRVRSSSGRAGRSSVCVMLSLFTCLSHHPRHNSGAQSKGKTIAQTAEMYPAAHRPALCADHPPALSHRPPTTHGAKMTLVGTPPRLPGWRWRVWVPFGLSSGCRQPLPDTLLPRPPYVTNQTYASKHAAYLFLSGSLLHVSSRLMLDLEAPIGQGTKIGGGISPKGSSNASLDETAASLLQTEVCSNPAIHNKTS